ncbi:YheC/YheD family protein [Neobacillus sp. MM2021_6]|uniref:YheC/YheD family endospore coat-associated protein n=1 Tax=Bacillaceae TaxID=186817 RepID=UPI00140C20A1|nr:MULTISPECIES: YheC/YheD family protein [Bacillaceae]MBO0961318.1 YheC/YheD family protein [Neobacillus sp. MM2021_6]NHC18789.1 YheC/YheD family protein [Bacillus sp. MM2020_4]
MSYSLTPIRVKLIPKTWTNKDTWQIQMSNKLLTHLQLNKNRKLNIKIGQKTITSEIQIAEIAINEIHLPDHMIKALLLPIQCYTFQAIVFSKSHTLKLGPVIGLLTDFKTNQMVEPYFRTIHLFCEELHRGICEHGGFFYVFSFDQFSDSGYYLEDGKWVPANLPMPDVIYNRIHSRKLENSTLYKVFRQKLDEHMIPFFNDRFLSKWEAHEKVKIESQLYSYIPETKICSKELFYDFAQKYETIFLKPIHGSQGRNIIKVKEEGHQHYTLQTSLPALTNHLTEKYSLDEIYQQIKPLLHHQIYIIQQGITFIKHQSRTMDFRVLCHKDQNNQWIVTSTVARIAAEKEFVSNLAKGGTITRPLNALRTCMSDKQSIEVLALIKELALETAEVISRHSEGITGELGIDIGVDQEGKPWLIEVNSKPSKNFEDGLGKIRPSAKAIIQFCSKLAHDSALEKEELN